MERFPLSDLYKLMNRARQNTGVTADIREQIFPVVLFNKS